MACILDGMCKLEQCIVYTMYSLNSECTRQLDTDGSVIKFSMSAVKVMKAPALVAPCCCIHNFLYEGVVFCRSQYVL